MTHNLPSAPEFGAPVDLAPSDDVLNFLARRRSFSAMGLSAPGPSAAELADLLQLAGRVPDHGKLAPWRFVILEGEGKAKFAAGLEAIAQARGDTVEVAKLGKLKTPPLCVAVISSPRATPIPEWEQLLSAGAVCTNLLYATLAMGFGANWITDWYAYDPQAGALLGLAGAEKVAGFVMIGTAKEAPLERERPNVEALTSRWTG